MENASKALIIAGAILISIVIISLGILVVNNVRGTATDANINSEEAQAFNAKFNLGQHLTGSQVNSIMQTVISENGANRNDPDYTLIVVTYSGSNCIGSTVKMNSQYGSAKAKGNDATTETYMMCTFDTSKYFNVTASAYASNGYISEITVTDNNNT